ncbi:hypothetical protein Tco_1180278, partial [Tanacetum coccineum]
FLIMSSDNASSAVTYTSISSYSNGPSWGIPLMNVGELPEMDPYEEVEDPPYVDDTSLTVESPGYIADSESMEEDYIDYPDKPEDDDEDPEEDPYEYHDPEDDDEDPEEDLSKEHEPEDEDTKEGEPSEGSNETEFPAYDQAPLGHRAAMICMRDDIPEEDMPPQRRFILTAPPPGCDVAESSAAAARPPRGQYDFVNTVEAGQSLIRSPGHDARTITRAANRAEDVGYVRALQASEHRMMTSIKEVNLRVSYQEQVRRQESEDFYTQLHDARNDRRDIRLEIDVVRGQRTSYATELHEVRHAYLSFEARNRALLARLETMETHMSRVKWQRQRVEDDAVIQTMRIHVVEARAQIDTVEDIGSRC